MATLSALAALEDLLPLFDVHLGAQVAVLVGVVLLLRAWTRGGAGPKGLAGGLPWRRSKAVPPGAARCASVCPAGLTPRALSHCTGQLEKEAQKKVAKMRYRAQGAYKFYSQAICDASRERNWQLACHLLEEMLRKNISASATLYNAVIGACGRSGQLDIALRLFGEMAEEGYPPNAQTYSVLAVCCKAKMLDRSISFLMAMHEKGMKIGPVALNVVLGGCNAQSRPRDALWIFERLPRSSYEADAGTYNALITSCERMKLPEKAVHFFSLMLERGIKPDTITYNALMTALGKEKADVALRLFEEMIESGVVADVITYNLIINACARARKVTKAYELFEQMLQEGLEPTTHSYGALMLACNRCGMPDWAMEKFYEMREKGVKMDAAVYNTAIKAAGLLRDARTAIQLFQEMASKGVEQGVVTYTCLIAACSQGGLDGMSFVYFDRMKQAGHRPDKVAFASVLLACAISGDAARAVRYLQEMGARGLPADVKAYNTVVESFASNGQGEAGLAILEAMKGGAFMPKPDAATYNAIIPGVSASKATELFSEMVELELEPSRRVYAILEKNQWNGLP